MARMLKGFSLIELMVVLTVLGVLSSQLLPLLRVASDRLRYWRSEQTLNATQQALLGFLSLHGRLPCPASVSSQGLEDCQVASGFVPGRTLALHGPQNRQLLSLDGWAQPILYAVGRQRTSGEALFESQSQLAVLAPIQWVSDLEIHYRPACGVSFIYASQLAAVVVATNRQLAAEGDVPWTWGPKVLKGLCAQDNDARLISEHRVLLELLYSGARSSL
jgi:prepilin-type N-terminal cleavage/methylation domain-containing protein